MPCDHRIKPPGNQQSPQHRIQIRPFLGLESDAPEEQSRGGRDGGVLGEGQDGGVGREADGDGHHEHGGAQGADQVGMRQIGVMLMRMN